MVEPSTLAGWGLPGLFLASALAGSVLPAPSEAVLALLVYSGVDPIRACVVGTLGNVLGATTVFLLGRHLARGGGGRWGAWVERRRAQAGPRLARVEQGVRRWGAPVLLLSWLPFVGDLFVLAAGGLGIRFLPFLAWVAIGKGLRYALVAASVAP